MSTAQIEHLAVAKLIADPKVQRAIDVTRVGRIVNDFDSRAVAVPIVSRREDGSLHVIDGWHRVQATIAAGNGDDTIMCLVHEGLSRADEAAMFRRLNNTRQVTPVDKFRVRVVEGDEAAVTLNNILTKYGWKAEMSKYNTAFAAVAAFEGIYKGKLAGPGSTVDVCDTLIRVITEAWGHDSAGVRSEIISGIGAVLLRYNTRVDIPKLINTLAAHKNGPRGLIGRARGLHEFRGGRLADSTAEILVEEINKQKKKEENKLPDWRSAA